ncbi:LysE/ArgO family amino acid transporter [Clostridium guangxiense]|uniref:LysE/ArgO family amino acid transporter n=1 Tax=Clostridium guangxiense TaxID=1662055 RepID=UPI001E607C4E|nr:LysE family transporter [Clostridium guangxiense]
MIKYYIEGLILGFTYVAPIGVQNLYVINSAICNKRIMALRTALVTVFFDISLAITCYYGVGIVLSKSQILKDIILLCGAIIVIYIGVRLIMEVPNSFGEVNSDKNFLKLVTACFTVTWLNPQAIIDGSLMLGGFKASLSFSTSKLFILGVCTASFLWFTSLSLIVNYFKKNFSVRLVGIINKICGVVITYYGLKLAVSFIKGLGVL